MNKTSKIGTVVLIAAALSACGCGPQPVSNANTTAATPRSEHPQTVTAHSTENLPTRPGANSSAPGAGKWSASGEPIDTAKFDGTISAAEKIVQSKPSDDQAKKDLAPQAYFDRGYALTEARQYAAALGDYRRALKYDPNHEESKKWIGQIVGIYGMLKKEAPKEGEEPAALPFKKT